MKKYKNLSKPELMEKQNTLSVHSGGRFVSLDLETEVQHAGSCKKKAEQILATVVMGMNLVNTVAPLAVLVAAEQKLGAAPQPARSEASLWTTPCCRSWQTWWTGPCSPGPKQRRIMTAMPA